MTSESRNERATRYERYLLAALLLEPRRITDVAALPENFLTESHRSIFAAMLALSNAGEASDIVSVADRMNPMAANFQNDCIYLGGLISEPGVMPECAERYARKVRQAHRERQFESNRERLGMCETTGERLELLAAMQEELAAEL